MIFLYVEHVVCGLGFYQVSLNNNSLIVPKTGWYIGSGLWTIVRMHSTAKLCANEAKMV